MKERGGGRFGPAAFVGLLVWVSSVAGLVVTLSRVVHANAAGTVTIGNVAPGFTAPDLDGHVYALEAYHGRPVIVNFWATWCVPCRQEMPILQTAYERHKEVALAVLALSQDSKDSQEAVREYVANGALTLQVLLDPDGTVAGHYNVLFLPSTVFVNANGVITGIHRGPVTARQLEQYLATMLSP